MSKQKKKSRKDRPSPDSKVNLVTAFINLIIALIQIFAIMKD